MRQPTLFNKIKSIQLNIAGVDMTHHIKGQGRHQVTLLPEVLDDFVTEDIPVRVIDVFVEGLQLDTLGFERVNAKQTGRPGYPPPRNHAEAVHLWILEPHSVIPQVRKRSP
jgi:hypothetical protein